MDPDDQIDIANADALWLEAERNKQMNRETIFSPCRKYRYTLWREWDTAALVHCSESSGLKPRDSYVQFIGLNPSTADETQDDQTIRRCIGFAKAWGYGAVCMTNIFAWRDTDPEKMKAEPFPVGFGNDYHIARIGKNAGLIIAAWGNDGAHLNRSLTVRAILHAADLSVHCLGQNASGEPKHPLYLAASTKPTPLEIKLASGDVERFAKEIQEGK